jgi:hypothetical protein
MTNHAYSEMKKTDKIKKGCYVVVESTHVTQSVNKVPAPVTN